MPCLKLQLKETGRNVVPSALVTVCREALWVRWNVSSLPKSSSSATGSKESLQEGLALWEHEKGKCDGKQ